MAEVVIREYSELEVGQHYRRKMRGPGGEEEYQYVLANQFFGDPGFVIRQGVTRAPDGGLFPASVTGGGNGDYIVKDLVTGRLDVVRNSDFHQFERVAVSRLPKNIKLAVGELEAPSAAEG